MVRPGQLCAGLPGLPPPTATTSHSDSPPTTWTRSTTSGTYLPRTGLGSLTGGAGAGVMLISPTAQPGPASVTSQPTLSRGSTKLRRSLQPADGESPGTGHVWWD